MQFQGAVIKEQGVTFGVLVVKSYVLSSAEAQAQQQAFGRRAFGAMPIVLMAQDSRGVPTYFGRPDLVKFLARLHISQIPWKQYTLANA